MVSCRRLALTLCIMGLMSVSSATQTSSELQQKYGSPDENGQYTIRPNVVASVVCQSDDQACRILIKPKRSALLSEGDTQQMPPQMVAEVIKELSPANQRGAFINSTIFNAGCTSISTDDYERVRISKVTTCISGEGVLSAEILKKQPKKLLRR